MISSSRLAFLLAVLLLAGCAQQEVRNGTPEAGSGADSTGRLGELRARSPADVYVQLAAEYLKEGNLEVALTNAQKATIVDPNNAAAHSVHALIRQRLGQDDLAESAFRSALNVSPRDPYALNAYGGFLCKKRRYEEAEQMFTRALQNPLYESPWVADTNAGVCAQRAGNLALAETHLRSALRRNARFAPALLQMANVSFKKQKYLSSRAYLQRYEEVASHSAESLWLGVRTEQRLGDQDQSSSYKLLLESRFPDSEEVRLLQEAETR